MIKRASQKPKTPLYKRLLKTLAWIVGIAAILMGVIYIAFQVSPWPSALLLRDAFNKDAVNRIADLAKYVPANVSSIPNLQYKINDKDAYLDAYFPSSVAGTKKSLPTIVWVHGGGWISGDKKDVGQYAQILANKGYTTIALNYSIAPEKTYPTPVIQVNEALSYINRNAEELHVDPSNIVLAGDSAGSQIAAQVATLITNPSYAKLTNMTPSLQPSQLSAMLLNCGAYDLSIINADGNSEDAKLLRTFLWSYSGKKDFLKDSDILPASVIDHVTKDFPPTFITAGNKDPLERQSRLMAKKLQSLGVTTDSLFYNEDYTPALPHEYQFNLDTDAGKKALSTMTTFLGAHTK